VPVSRPAVAGYPAGSRLPTRVIDDFELVWMLQGRARFVAGEDLALVPGQLLLIPPDLPHSLEWDPHRTSEHGYVHFGSEHFDGEPVGRAQRRTMTRHDPLAASCAYLLWLAHLPRDDWEPPVSATLRFMLKVFLSGPLPVVPQTAELAPPLEVVIEHLATEWSALPLRRIAIGELAAVSSVSRGYLTRLFRDSFALGPAAALERVRFSRAEAMLERTDLTADAIAQQCGFADASHFSHRFSAVYGMPPRTYRSTPDARPSVLDDAGTRRLAHLLWNAPSRPA
jgi:AraC family transcriptional regulator